jgi:ATP-dependent DNA helicase 2 subunit 1
MGFKSIERIKPYYNIRESYFIYPNELYSNGSSKLIDALIKQMLNKNKCAIVKFIAREGSVIKLCALIPQAEKYDEDYFQTPPGFNMIVLPWADDIRSNADIMARNPKEMPLPNDNQNELAKKIIKKMNISFDCRAFENYELQKFYATLQALALDEPNIEPVEDTMQPNEEGLEKVLDGLDEEFRKAVFGNYGGKPEEVMEKYNKGNKNKNRSKGNNSKSSRSQSKKRKKKEVDDEIKDAIEEENVFTDDYIKKMVKNNKLEKLKVDELKNICRNRNINTKGLKKADIISKIKNYLANED